MAFALALILQTMNGEILNKHYEDLRDQSLLMVGGGAEDIKGGSPIIFLPRWGGQIKNQTARGGAMKNNQLKLTSILFRNK